MSEMSGGWFEKKRSESIGSKNERVDSGLRAEIAEWLHADKDDDITITKAFERRIVDGGGLMNMNETLSDAPDGTEDAVAHMGLDPRKFTPKEEIEALAVELFIARHSNSKQIGEAVKSFEQGAPKHHHYAPMDKKLERIARRFKFFAES